MLAVSPVIMLKPKLGQTRRETANLDSIACSTEGRERSLKRTLKVCSILRIEKNFCQP